MKIIRSILIMCFLLSGTEIVQAIAINELADQFAYKAKSFKFDLKTQDGLNMDCLKPVLTKRGQ